MSHDAAELSRRIVRQVNPEAVSSRVEELTDIHHLIGPTIAELERAVAAQIQLIPLREDCTPALSSALLALAVAELKAEYDRTGSFGRRIVLEAILWMVSGQ